VNSHARKCSGGLGWFINATNTSCTTSSAAARSGNHWRANSTSAPACASNHAATWPDPITTI
jgi:hypothetical protein